ncbi:MAG: uroporphyrinogen decarboxylase family protein [Treponema sp.]|jgi:uroporphyrinogen decarboxylase|nr:uroporphyrinogen decarboxylase family protein [Treponema sp.]
MPFNAIDRFYATVERRPVDRPAAWLGVPDEGAEPGLFAEYGVKNLHELKAAVGDDFYGIRIPYRVKGKRVTRVWDWYLDGVTDRKDRTLTADGCFKDCESPDDLGFFTWPDPAQSIDREDLKAMGAQVPPEKTGLGLLWSVHFQDTCASFGLQTALMNMLANPEVVEAVNSHILNFYLAVNEIFYQTVGDRFHAVLMGNDMGTQRGLMLSPALVRRFVMPGCRALVEQAHHYGKKVIYHSCGSITDIIPDLIDAGVDVIHPIQAQAAGMDPRNLKERYGNKVAFCGGVDTQYLLVQGSPREVAAKVRELRELFPTGLIISPSHESILPDVPPRNIRALFEEAKRIY